VSCFILVGHPNDGLWECLCMNGIHYIMWNDLNSYSYGARGV
jgi:hypothetical protein